MINEQKISAKFGKSWKVKCMTSKVKHSGLKNRELCEKQNMLLRLVTMHTEVDIALNCKISKGNGAQSELQVFQTSKLLKAIECELLALWMVKKLENEISGEKIWRFLR